MTTIADVLALLDEWAPESLAESWDNTGLLLGDRAGVVRRIMTCLTVTPAVVEEAIQREVTLLLSHHPLPFRPLNKITTDQANGRLLWTLASHRISIASLHTRYDSAALGINQQLAESLGLREIRPLQVAEPAIAGELGGPAGVPAGSAPPAADEPPVGRGRWGKYPQGMPLETIAEILKSALGIRWLKHVSSGKTWIHSVAIGCGSAGEFLRDAAGLRCDLLVVGETSFHTCLEAQSQGVELLLTGHYASERFGLESLAGRLAGHYPQFEVWCSHAESNPIRWI